VTGGEGAPAALARPRWRGVIHQYAFFASLPVGVGLVAWAPSPRAAVATAVYAGTVSSLFAVSALYHRVTWSPRARQRMRRLDHAMIFAVIAGAYTPWALLILHGPLAEAILIGLWASVLGGVILNVAWIDAPKTLTAVVYALIGLTTAGALPQLFAHLGPAGASLLIVAGALSATGGTVYALRRPNPAPTTFGYHEVFHALVTAALALLYLAIAIYAIHPQH